jgi:hypothetical protein
MTSDWQNLAAIALVIAALAYLVRQSWQVLARRRSAGCGSCPTCPADSSANHAEVSANGKPLMSIDALVKTARKD